jgi:hypothetical protein
MPSNASVRSASAWKIFAAKESGSRISTPGAWRELEKPDANEVRKHESSLEPDAAGAIVFEAR